MISGTPDAFATMVYSLPYAIVTAGMALSWRFNRSKIFYILLILALSYWSTGGLVSEQPTLFAPEFSSGFLQSIFCLLLPLNILIFSSIKERGIFTTRGLVRLGIILLQLGAVLWIWMSFADKAIPVMRYEIWPSFSFLNTNISHFGIIFIATALFMLVYRIVTIGSTLDYGLVVTLGVVTYLLHDWNLQTLIWLEGTAAFVLVISLVQDAYKKAYVDELTGLPGRRSMEEYFLKLSGKYSVAMVDIDHFKVCNDRYGHDVGDQILRMIASFLKNVERGGKSFRYGGEEFVIVFPGKMVSDIHSSLDILRQTISDNRFVVRSFFRSRSKPDISPSRENQKRLAVNVSIGCAERTEDDYLPADVIKRADKALYEAKETGRNKVCIG